MELLLRKFILEHKDWEELLTAAPYNLKISRDDGYIMFKYSQLDSDFNNPIVREARGIILDEANDYLPVCVPFFKFGNYGESYCPDIDWSNCSVQQKVDGSLMKVWYANGGWHVSTNGTIKASNAKVGDEFTGRTFLDVFYDAVKNSGLSIVEFFSMLTGARTYMFELVSPETRVVIDYPKTELYFLGYRDNDTLKEYNKLNGKAVYNKLEKYFKTPTYYPMTTFEEVKKAADSLPWNEEGYVVCDKEFNRVKIKSPEYVKAHYGRLNGNISAANLIEIILNNEVDEFLVYASDYSSKISLLTEGMNNFKAKVRKLILDLNPSSYETRKAYAEVVNQRPVYLRRFLFRYDDLDSVFTKMTKYDWEDIMKLEGVLHD